VVQVGGLGGGLLQEAEAADRPDGQLRRRPQELRRLPGNRLVPVLQNFFDRNLRILVINIALPKVVCLFLIIFSSWYYICEYVPSQAIQVCPNLRFKSNPNTQTLDKPEEIINYPVCQSDSDKGNGKFITLTPGGNVTKRFSFVNDDEAQ
jgi:hypothetical protein